MQQIGVHKPPPRINLGSDLACDEFLARARRTDCYLLVQEPKEQERFLPLCGHQLDKIFVVEQKRPKRQSSFFSYVNIFPVVRSFSPTRKLLCQIMKNRDAQCMFLSKSQNFGEKICGRPNTLRRD